MDQSLNKNPTEYDGLSTHQAEKLLGEFGYNSLPEEKRISPVVIFLNQFKSPLVYVLLSACVVTFFLKDYSDSLIIFLAVLLNTILGYVQESKAGKALDALKKMLYPTCQVVRDGEVKQIDVKNIVPGDIVILTLGDKVPADGIVLEGNKLFVSEAFLTGESENVHKDKDSIVYMGSLVSSGKAYIRIIETGSRTEMGKIAQSISKVSEPTPLHKQLAKFSNQLSIFIFFVIILVFLVGIFYKHPLQEVFVTSVALAVSSIPEGLLVALTAVLALGMQRILSRKGLVRNLVSAETLGGVTTICTDKTGTLTQGKMQVINVIGDSPEIAFQTTLSNDLDTSVVIAAWEWGKKQKKHGSEKMYTKIDGIPFSSAEKLSAGLYTSDSLDYNTIFITGAPDVLLEYCNLAEETKSLEFEKIKQFSKEGKRLLAFARKSTNKDVKTLNLSDIKNNLDWVGMLAFNDPIREEVAEALKKTHLAGIKLIVITGDFSETARSVLKQLGIYLKKKNIITGQELENITKEDLALRLSDNNDVKLFARVRPDQKLKIIETLKANGEVVAMTGDGVNDAPALAIADIGIVVGDASDVAKESSDLVLLDSSFSVIAAAIEEGRTIFDNIRKIILFLLSDSFEEIVLVLSALIFGLPVPLTASQILWVNLVSDGFPSLALTVDPGIKNSMQIPPRSPKEPLITNWMLKIIGLASFFGGISALILFWYINSTTGNTDLARSVAFATVGVNSLIYVFSIRSLKAPFWNEGLFTNKWLVVSVILGFILQLLPFLSPGLKEFFQLESIGGYWLAVFSVSFAMFLIIEVVKISFRQKSK